MAEQISKEQIDDAFKLAKDFESGYWNSELPDYMNLIEDLRLSNNIHETAHSRVLYKLLCCGKCHSYPLLRTFLKVVGFKDIEIKDTDNVKLFVEKENIDLLIEIGDKVIILENKINHAKDQDRQIEKYYNNIKKNHEKENIYVIYLTRSDSDSDPNKNSFPDSVKDELKEKYKKISYEKEIREWIYECKKGWKNELISSIFIQYGDFIESMFEPNKKRIEIMNELIEQLLKIEIDNTTEDKLEAIHNKLKDIFNAENTLTDFKKNIENYTIDCIEKELRSNKILCESNYREQKIDFCVTYKDRCYRGIVNLDQNDYGFWFGLRIKNNCLVNWDDKMPSKINIDDINELGIELKDHMNKHIDNYIDKYDKSIDKKGNSRNLFKNCDDYTDQKDAYAFWKYCNYMDKPIKRMINEIKEYVSIIKSIGIAHKKKL